MWKKFLWPWSFITLGIIIVGAADWPARAATQQEVMGQARAVQATVLGAMTILSDTGTLSGSSDARETSLLTGSVPAVLTGEALHAATIGYPDQVDSEASLGGLGLTVSGTGISADFVMARAQAVSGGVATGLTNIDGLRIGGVPIFPTGGPNQTLSFGLLTVVLNEQIPSPGGITVNALHIRTIDGLTDVVIGSAKASVGSMTGSSSPVPPLPPLL
jgi:hypothetical protein